MPDKFKLRTDKVKFIADIRCFDTKGGTCYLSKRVTFNPSVSAIFESFESSTIPVIQSRLPVDKIGRAHV